MSVVAEFTIPPDAVPAGTALEAMPKLTIELERIVPSNDTALPFFWVHGGDVDSFVEHAREDDEIESLEVLARVHGSALLKATWRPDATVIEGIKTLRATIMEATGTAEEWRFQVRGESRERLDEFRCVFTDQGIPVRLERIYNFSEMAETKRPLTEEQRETLLVAYREGYFEQPRKITQEGLAEHFGISPRAISNRLRRATRNLVASRMLETLPPDTGD
jgi:predicted DNA binding protein